MQVTAIELLVYADSLERLRASDFSNADKEELQKKSCTPSHNPNTAFTAFKPG